MNHCPRCNEPLRFVGIHTLRRWLRWDHSPYCGLYTVRNEHGAFLAVSEVAPPRDYFTSSDMVPAMRAYRMVRPVTAAAAGPFIVKRAIDTIQLADRPVTARAR